MWQGNGDEDPLASWASILESMDHYRQSVLACGAATELTEDGAGCYAYDGCDGATLCEYDGVGHEYPPSYTASAWAYLNADWDLGAADATFEADYTCEAEAGWGITSSGMFGKLRPRAVESIRYSNSNEASSAERSTTGGGAVEIGWHSDFNSCRIPC